MRTGVKHCELETDGSSRLSNSQTPGIGRLTALDGHLVINNLGRNIESTVVEQNRLRQIAKFDDTIYQDKDDEQQFDIDMHSFLRWDEWLLAINHYGLIRIFNWHELTSNTAPDAEHQTRMVTPWFCAKWPGDVERLDIFNDHLVSSSPQGYSVPDPAQSGLLISSSLRSFLSERSVRRDGADCRPELPYSIHLQDWGPLSTIAMDSASSLIAVAAQDRVGLFRLTENEPLQTGLGEVIFDERLPFAVTYLQFDRNHGLFAAGHALPKQDAEIGTGNDWDNLLGGGFWRINIKTSAVAVGQFDLDLAFGNGGDPIVLSDNGESVFGIDRYAGLHRWSVDNGRYEKLCHPSSSAPLGLAHACILDDSIYCGFNRNGYRIHRYKI